MPPTYDRTTYLKRIRQIRHDFYDDNTVHELADSLGIPLKTWENYEKGVAIPDMILLSFLCLTGATPQWLLTGDGMPYLADSQSKKRFGPTGEH